MIEKIDSFDFQKGRILGRKYEILEKIGQGWESEVYKLKEIETGIERAGKFFFPHRNINNKTLKYQAKQCHKLRHCKVLIKYNTIETMYFKRQKIFFLVSDYINGQSLASFIDKQPGKRLQPFEALHLLYALAKGISQIHRSNEYHGDLHTDNIMVERYGMKYELKVFDFFRWTDGKKENVLEDVCAVIRIFYDSLGGKRFYHKQRKEIKEIICGLKRNLIKMKFKNAEQLVIYLENISFLDN